MSTLCLPWHDQSIEPLYWATEVVDCPTKAKKDGFISGDRFTGASRGSRGDAGGAQFVSLLAFQTEVVFAATQAVGVGTGGTRNVRKSCLCVSTGLKKELLIRPGELELVSKFLRGERDRRGRRCRITDGDEIVTRVTTRAVTGDVLPLPALSTAMATGRSVKSHPDELNRFVRSVVPVGEYLKIAKSS